MQTYRKTYRQTDRPTDRHAERQTDRETDRQEYLLTPVLKNYLHEGNITRIIIVFSVEEKGRIMYLEPFRLLKSSFFTILLVL